MSNRNEAVETADLSVISKEYWTNKLKEAMEPTELPVGNGNGLPYKKAVYECPFEQGVSDKLLKMSNGQGMPLFSILLATVSIETSKYVGRDELVFHIPPFGKMEKNRGFHCDLTLPLPIQVDSNGSLREHIIKTQQALVQGYKHQYCSVKKLQEVLNAETELSELCVALENFHDGAYIKGIIDQGRTPFILRFNFNQNEIKGEIIFNENRFGRDVVERFWKHFMNLVSKGIEDVQTKISRLDMVSDGEKAELLNDFNGKIVPYSKDKTVHELFEENALEKPEAVALVFEDKEMTYKELNERSNQLARELRARGVEPNSVVAIMMDRSLEMIIGMLGVLKSGGAYLPVDPKHPEDRKGFMFEDSNIKVLLTQDKYMAHKYGEIESLSLENANVYQEESSNFVSASGSEDLAYVIYTSGSTGNPKGVEIQHRAVNNFISSVADEIEFGSGSAILALTSMSFDIFVLESLLPLLNSMKVVIASDQDTVDTESLANTIVNNHVGIMQATPSRMKMILEHPNGKGVVQGLKTLLVGGDTFTENLLDELKELSECKIYNMYGPTEATVWATLKELSAVNTSEITIGKPLGNYKVMILDKDNQVQPVGVSGELCILGDSLARGYQNRTELTEEKFIKFQGDSGERMYRTGDLARWLPNGEIEFLGRIDNQVKVRGYRIELSEIEKQILAVGKIGEAVVLAKSDQSGDKYLCAYYVGEELEGDIVREKLSANLPEYMIPSHFIQLEKMPLNINGKIDRKALPEPNDFLQSGSEYVAPRTKEEEQLVALYKSILGLELEIGVKDDFFKMGGHSLKATTLISRVYKEMEVIVPLVEVFENPTVEGLAKYIDTAEKTIYDAIKPVENRGYYPMSSAQKRMYIGTKMDENNTHLNMPMAMVVEGPIDFELFNDSFKEIIRRHESLRTSFAMVGDDFVQKVSSYEEMPLEVGYSDETMLYLSKEEIEARMAEFIQPFDLDKGHLVRVNLLKVSSDKHILMMDMHHIITDGTSAQLIINDFIKLYNNKPLESVGLQYKDYAVWQADMIKSGDIAAEEKYWIEKFSEEIPVLNLATDYNRPSKPTHRGRTIEFTIDRDVAEGLRTLSRESGATLYITLLSAYNLLLHRYTQQDDIVVGTVVAGRPHVDLEKMVGLFINTLPMRNYPSGNMTFKEFLDQVKGNTFDAFRNQNMQLEELVEKLDLKRDLSRNLFFDVMFILQNMDGAETEFEELKIYPFLTQNTEVAKLDLNLVAIENKNGIVFHLQYATDLFKEETIEKMGEHFVNILKDIVLHPDNLIDHVAMLSVEERKHLLYDLNDTKADYNSEDTVMAMFESKVDEYPDRIAAVFEEKSLTYRELDRKANQIAWMLREKGLKRQDRVAIITDKSLEMLIGIFGIMKIGATYIPIDPEYPMERIQYIVEDSQPDLILRNTQLVELKDMDAKIIEIGAKNIDMADVEYELEEGVALGEEYCPDDIAYIMYTSGSTGKPKGVVVEHRNIAGYIKGFKDEFKVTKEDSVLQQSNYCWDTFVEEAYPILTEGGKLVIVKKYDTLDVNKLAGILEDNQVTLISCTPLLLNELNKLPPMESVKIVISGGDVLKPEYIDNIVKYADVYNTYGPTETTVCASYYKCATPLLDTIPIGKPISNYQIHILDKNSRLLPKGVPGELCIAGAGMTRGYLNRDELSAEKFVTNPFVEGERLYRTGDVARWLPDGNIEFLGRSDHQIKVRGQRIELGEIESHIMTHEGVVSTVVIPVDDHNGNKQICAYVACREEFDMQELRNYLLRKLPSYMVPLYFIPLEELPMTVHGKIDIKALPAPTENLTRATEHEVPQDELEARLAKVWGEVLEIENVGVNEDFLELGGDSIKMIQLMTKIEEEFGKLISIGAFYSNSTIRELAVHLSGNDTMQSFLDFKDMEYALHKKEGNQWIFAFPPITGHGIVYRDLSQNIKSHSICAFDFLVNENRISRYIEIIKSTQKEGPYTFLGYSAGGNLAFEVAREMELMGETIENIILVDSGQKLRYTFDSENRAEEVERIKNVVEERLIRAAENSVFESYFKIDKVKEDLKDKISKYYIFHAETVNSGILDTNIHVIQSEYTDEEAINSWKDSITGTFKIHDGSGSHNMMLEQKENYEIIREILEDSQCEKVQ